MVDLSKYGIPLGQGPSYQQIVYGTALVYDCASKKVDQYLAKYQLNLSKINILVAIRVHGKQQGLRQVELSQHLILTPSNMTKMIDKLEKEGMVTRSALAGDRRVKIVKVTAKAENIVDDLWDGFQATLKELVQGLDSVKQKQLAELLMQWSRSLLA